MSLHEFTFKDLDKEGLETLLAISNADAFNKWMYNTIAPYLHGDILELGSGIGNISAFVLNDNKQLFISDVRANYCELLKNNFSGFKTLTGVEQIDLIHPEFDSMYASLLNSFDTVFSLNVIEHIKQDELAIQNAAKLLRTGGRLLTLVPAFMQLYNKMDKELHHYRRYTRQELIKLVATASLTPQKTFYFNALGMAGWMINGLLNKSTIGSGQMKAYNQLVPLARFTDFFFSRFAGLSVISVAVK